MKVLITGANGQLGRALQERFVDSVALNSANLDITDAEAVKSLELVGAAAIINAAAYTDVDGAETPTGKERSTQVNTEGVRNLAKLAIDSGVILIHVSTEYVFDGEQDSPYSEDDKPNPKNNYGKSKLTGEVEALKVDESYVIRTSWLIGDGANFVRTMVSLGERDINPSVVDDQFGRPTFTEDLADFINHLLSSKAKYGTYHFSNDGDVVSWADFAREIYASNDQETTVTAVSTEEYFKDKPEAARRPRNSTLDLSKTKATGYQIKDWRDALKEYLEEK